MNGLWTELLLLDCQSTAREVVHFYDAVLASAQRSAPVLDESDGRRAYIQYNRPNQRVDLLAQEAHPGPDAQDPAAPRLAISVSWEEWR